MRIPPKCTLTKFDMGYGANPRISRSLHIPHIPACSSGNQRNHPRTNRKVAKGYILEVELGWFFAGNRSLSALEMHTEENSEALPTISAKQLGSSGTFNAIPVAQTKSMNVVKQSGNH